MATTVHIPKPLLDAVDRRAHELHVSRNKLIVQAIEREVGARSWPKGFFESLGGLDQETKRAFTQSMNVVHTARRSKRRPPRL